MKKSTFVWSILIMGLVACADPKNRKQYIEALENQVFENNVNLSMKPGQSVEIKDQSGNIKKTPLIDKDGDGIAEGLDLDGDGVIDVNVMKGRHKKETAEKFTIEIDINGDGITDYHFAVEKTATGYRITLVAGNSTSSQQLTILQTSDVITGIDSTGDNVSDDNRLNGKNCTNTGSAHADSTAPSVPGSLTATAAGQDQINLTWTASIDNTSPTGNLVYEICQSTTAGGCNTFSVTFNSTAGATSFSATSLTTLTTYYYRIRARDIAANRSATTGEQSATTQSAGTVANPTFSPSAGFFTGAQTVNLTSTTTGATFCSTTNGSAPTCNPAGGCQTGTAGASVNISATATLKTVACRSGYVASAEVSDSYTIDSVAPGVPSAPSASAAGSDQVQLNWTAATDNTSAAANLVYEICQSTTSGACDTFSVTYTTGAGATSYLIGSLTPVTTYYFRVRSKDQAGNVGTPTAQQSATTTTAGTASAPAFSPVAGTYNSIQNVTITSTTSGALICFTTNGSTPACNATPTCTTGTTYSAAVAISSTADLRAIACKAVMTNSSVTLGAYTIDTVAPANVTSFTATGGSNQVSLAWTNPGDADFAGVKLVRKTGSYPTDHNDGTTIYNGTGNSYTNTGLSGGTQYYYKAFSYDAAANYSGGAQATATTVVPGATAQWGKTMSSGTYSEFLDVTSDSQGNAIAVGYQQGTGSYTYGTGVTVSGNYSANNAVVVKYNATGTAVWARVPAGTSTSGFLSVAVDSSDNIFLVGYLLGTTSFNFGSGVTVSGPAARNLVIAKYNANGAIQWVRSANTGPSTSLTSLSVSSNGNIFVCGYQYGANHDYGNSILSSGAYGGDNFLAAKYDSAGNALWARSVSTGSSASYCSGISVDAAENVYVTGYQWGNSTFTYGPTAVLTGVVSDKYNSVLVKYDASGTAQWGVTPNQATDETRFLGVSVDTNGSVYIVGSQRGSEQVNYGNGTTLAGAAPAPNNHCVLAKYSSSGIPQWAKSAMSASASASTAFQRVAVDSGGNVFAAGYQVSNFNYSYGNGVSLTAGSDGGSHALVVKYDGEGTAQWATSTLTGSTSAFTGLALQSQTSFYVVGSQFGTSQSSYSSAAVTITGPSTGYNPIVLKYGVQ